MPDIEYIRRELEEYFGTPIPSPHNYPESFEYYLTLYREYRINADNYNCLLYTSDAADE